MMGESKFLVNLDRFSKYLRNFEKRSKLTKNSDFFARGEGATFSHHFWAKLGYSQIKIDRSIDHFTADSLLKD